MSPNVKNVLIIIAKNAVNAVLTNATLMATMHQTFYLTGNWHGIDNMLKVTLGVVLAREGVVFLPVILKWSQTNSTPDALDVAASNVQVEAKQAVQHAQAAQSAAADVKAIVSDAKTQAGESKS